MADQYGADGGTGNYIVAFPNTPYTLSLTSDVQGGVNLLRILALGAGPGKFVSFYGQNGQLLFTFNPQDAINAINQPADPSVYYGNPNPNFIGEETRGNHSFS